MHNKGDKVSDTFGYYYDSLLEEEDNIIEGAQNDLSWEDYLISSDNGKEDIQSDLIDDFKGWKSYPNDLKVIL
ncbi:hypothetical protein [Peribacillus sp. NPDC056705]|uniref:hypothetical protein n=1 Tax=Peribacillus sp. NPDC056705 TaxID=3345918 RepID=UPI003748A9A5